MVSTTVKKVADFVHFCLFVSILEKLAEVPVPVVKPPVPVNVNKWDGEDEDDVKVCTP